MKNLTVAKKIYNLIIDKLNKITNFIEYSSEILFWKDVKNKFEMLIGRNIKEIVM